MRSLVVEKRNKEKERKRKRERERIPQNFLLLSRNTDKRYYLGHTGSKENNISP